MGDSYLESSQANRQIPQDQVGTVLVKKRRESEEEVQKSGMVSVSTVANEVRCTVKYQLYQLYFARVRKYFLQTVFLSEA